MSPAIFAFLDFLKDNKEALALLGATAGGAFALWRWVIDQRWRRVQYAQSLIKEFQDKDTTTKAMEVLDLSNEQVDFETGDETLCILITDEFLIGALSTFDQKTENTEEETAARLTFDEFFGDLSNFQCHIDSGLIKISDIKPYLEYWFLELTGRGRSHGVDFAHQVARFLDYFGYERVLRLAKNLNIPFDMPPKGSSSA